MYPAQPRIKTIVAANQQRQSTTSLTETTSEAGILLTKPAKQIKIPAKNNTLIITTSKVKPLYLKFLIHN